MQETKFVQRSRIADKILARAQQNHDSGKSKFITGRPEKITRYGYQNKDGSKIITFVSFTTSGGSEILYNDPDCLTSAMIDSDVIVKINPNI
jgi:hypothetical protein